MTIDRDIDHLHPSMAEKVRRLYQRIVSEGLPFRVFETYRSPDRQAQLYAEGSGKTKAGPFKSAHQFGLACDFAVFDGREWHWPHSDDPIWDRLHALAYEVGLTAPITWDPGHIQWPNWRKLV